MQVLELEPLKKKKLKIILVQSEYPIEWYLEPPKKEAYELFPNLKFLSKEYINFIEETIQKYKPDFAIEEKGIRTLEEFLYDNPLIDLFKKYQIPYDCVDISDNALLYISSTLDRNKRLLKGINSNIKAILEKRKEFEPDNSYLKQLMMWRDYFNQEYIEKEEELRSNIREFWMMMGILEKAKKHEKKQLKALFICDKNHFNNIENLASELGIETTKINIKKIAKQLPEEGSLREIFDKSIIEIMPVKIKKKEKADRILYFFDTDEYASPFDINMAYDAGFDIVVPFNKVTKDNVTKLVQDAIFSRKPNAPTTFFVGGSNVNEGEKIAKKVLKALVPPFETPVIIDPRGSHTTAAAVVAKTIEAASDLGISNLMGKKIAILGTGPVGRIASILASRLHCETVIVETWEGSSEKFVKDLTDQLNKESGENASIISGEFANTDDKKFEILKNTDIIWSLAAAGIQILSKELISKLPKNILILDVNAVPPFGIEGLKPKDDKKEIQPGIYGIGSLAVGRLKYMIESKILKNAANTKGKKIFDYNFAFEIAQELLFGKKITVTQK